MEYLVTGQEGKKAGKIQKSNNRVVRKLQFLNNFLIKTAKYRTLVRYFARLVREPTGFSNKSNDVRIIARLAEQLDNEKRKFVIDFIKWLKART